MFQVKYSISPVQSSPNALFQKALDAHRRGAFAQARNLYSQVLGLQPAHSDTLHMLGVLEHSCSNHVLAIDLISRAIALAPQNPSSYLNLANAQKSLKLWDKALLSYERAIDIQPQYALAHSNRGALLHEMQRTDEALESLSKAIELNPNAADTYFNRGNIYKDQHELDAAIAEYSMAIQLQGGFAQALLNRGIALYEQLRLPAAIQDFDAAIVAAPNFADAYWNKALTLLLAGDFAKGWPLHEWRWKIKNAPSEIRNFSAPLWLGRESLEGKTILLHAEQGLGDSIQFCRYARLVAALGARVVLEVQKPLVNLLTPLDGVSEVIGRNDPLPNFDMHCPLLSLPQVFQTHFDNIPNGTRYLRASPKKVAQWSNVLGERKSALRIGLVWSGNTGHVNDRNRSIPLEEFLRLFPAGPEYFSLQKEVRQRDQAALHAWHSLRHFGDALTDFSDTAALCELMDVVISVDTSVAHLASALGRDTWVLLPRVPDWRWMLDRTDSPWYPSTRLFRQTSDRHWE